MELNIRSSALTACLAIVLGLFSACSAARPPVAPGVIPPPKPTNITDEQYGHQVFQDLADHYEQDYNHPRAVEVQNIVDRLTAAVGASNDPWHVYIFKDPKVKNAAATRGNHVFIWSGLLDATRSEDELATILAHEISHVLAGHTDPDPNEEAKKLLVAIGSMAAGIAVSAAIHSPSYGGDLGNLTSAVTSEVGNSLLLYPYSRDKEYEADQIGLSLMAEAKYDPQAAIAFWDRAKNDPDLNGNMGFLSTHPPAAERLQKLKEVLPLALVRFNNATGNPNSQQGASTAATTVLNPGSAASQGHSPPRHRPGNQKPSGGAIVPDINVPLPHAQHNKPAAPSVLQDGDSFAVGSSAPSGTKSSPPPVVRPRNSDRWIVRSPRALLFSEPSVRSRAIGEFSQGAKVEVVKEKTGWLQIISPDKGYLQRSEAEPG